MSFGEQLKNARVARGLRQDDIGRILRVGKSTISQWENNIHVPNLETVTKIANFLNVSVDLLLGRAAPLPPSPTEPFLNDLLKKVPDLTDEEKESIEEHMQFALKIIEKERLRRRAAAQKKDGDLL